MKVKINDKIKELNIKLVHNLSAEQIKHGRMGMYEFFRVM
jgi:hypothetical protein